MKKIRIAGPPGTGKTTYLVKKYYEALSTYQPADIMVISHTNTAANHIRGKIIDIKSMNNYLQETGINVLGIIQANKKILERNVSTIHKYCKNQLTGSTVFEINDYDVLKQKYPIFDKFTNNKKFYFTQQLFKVHPFFKFVSFARDNGKELTQYYRELSYEEKNEYKYSIKDLNEMNDLYIEYKTNSKINEGRNNILDFQDMVEKFCELPKDPVIKVLMVDEAQDSSFIQRKAEAKMSKNSDLFYKAGDPDQTIFEFAGADPDSFHREFAHPDVELEQGYRCPRLINEWCREVIKPIWQEYNYTRTWKPREENGQVVEGEIFNLMNLTQDPNLHELSNRLLNTKETFIFTYRGGEPEDIINFLIKNNMPMDFLSDKVKSFSYPKKEIEIQRMYLSFCFGTEALSLTKIKKIIKSIDSGYYEPGFKLENLEKLEKKQYTLDYFIDNGFLSSVIKKTSDFQNITAHSDLKIKNYVRNIVNNNRDLEDIRVFVANIHTIKGMEFDNVVLDLKINREERTMHDKKRIKFVAGSRTKKTLWTIKSKGQLSL
jgi:superfamily I DNA/RNA helicase